MKKIGIISFSKTNHQFMISLAKKLSKYNKVVFFLCFECKKLSKNRNIKFVKVFLSEKKITIKNLLNNFNYIKSSNLKNSALFHYLKKIKNFIYIFIYIVKRYLYSYIKYFFNKVDILISPGDRENIFELSLIKFAENDKKKIFIYPSAVAANPKSLIMFRENHFVKDDKFIKKFPMQIFKYKKKNYSFFGFYHTKIFNFLNILPLNPWTFAAKKGRKLILTSKILINYYNNLGTPKKNIKLIINDNISSNLNIFKNYTNQYSLFKKRNRLDEEKLILYINLPNWFEHNITTKIKAFERYNDFLIHLNNEKINKEYNLITSLHPTQNYNNYSIFLKKKNIHLLNEKFYNLYFYIDGLISLSGSSIFVDCKNLNIPFILLDMFEKDFKNDFYYKNLNEKLIIKSYKNLDLKFLKGIIKPKKKIKYMFKKDNLNIEDLILNS
jgi:hypothetical protein